MKKVALTRFVLAFSWITSSTLAGCAPHGAAVPRATEARRLVLAPSAIAALSAGEDTAGLATEVHFGGARGHGALFLRFPRQGRTLGEPLSASLVLTVTPFAPALERPVRIQVWRASSPWEPGELHTWSDKPTLAPPTVAAEATSAPPAELHIDVSEWVRFAAEHPERDFGLALVSQTSTGVGLSVSTGASGGRAPRLEILVR